MRALVLTALHTPPSIETVPDPACAPGEAVIRLQAAALNRRDLWICQGKYPGIRSPLILGSDGVGVVEAVGAGVDPAWRDREVILCPSLSWGPDEAAQGPDYQILGLPRDGTFAERIAVPAECLFDRPRHLSLAEAAALPLAGLTAWRALMTRAQLKPGERVLITGAGGGVSQLGLSLALSLGCPVVVTSSDPAKTAASVGRGALGGVDYQSPGWPAAAAALIPGGQFDVILDGAGGPGFGELARLLAPGGRLSFYGGTAGAWPTILPQHLFYKQISLLASTMGSPREFAALLAHVSAHRLTPPVDRCFPLAEGPAALERLAAGAQLGKLVLEISPSSP